jgi:hypothetical protein
MWAGISPAAATAIWRLVEDELESVEVGGRASWLHKNDLAVFRSPPNPEGARLLPPHDAYLAQRDRETLLSDATLRRRVWRAVGSPGAVLAAGRLVGTWRARKVRRRLMVAVEPFAPLGESERDQVLAEAELVARLRGCEAVDVELCR